MSPRVAIVTINYNGLRDTLACLKSLRADSYSNKKVIVVDNGSKDDAVQIIRRQFPEVTVFAAGRNLGFTGGNNLGLRHAITAGAKYVYWLNNDTTSDPGAVQALVEAAEAHPDAAMLTPVIHYFDAPDEAWFGGSTMDLSRGIAVHDNSAPPKLQDLPSDIPWASGCAMFGKCDVLERLGGFDDQFFLNWEDVDLCLRIRAEGNRVLIVPSARIYHKVGRTFSTVSHVGHYYYVRNNLLLLRLHAGADFHRAARRIILRRFRDSLRALYRGQSKPGTALSITMRAIWDHLARRYGQVAVRKPSGLW
jgi:GT2 family glycosyltransferase